MGFGLVVQLASGCDDSGSNDQPDAQVQTDATVPARSTTGALCDDRLSYANDIQPLLAQYCTRCHASMLTGAARMGAPQAYNFDTESGLLDHAHHVDEAAGSGPRQTNVIMPPSAPRPSDDERKKLSQFLACDL